MPIRFTCTGCSKTFNAPDTAAGRQVACPSCGTPNIVPGGGVASAPPPPPPAYAEAPGSPQVHYHMGGAPVGPPSPAMAITGMILGIVGFVLSFIPCVGLLLGVILGILGAVFSSIGLAQAMKSQAGKGMAITGLSLSVLAIIWVPILWAIEVAMLASAVNNAANNINNSNPTITFPNPPSKP